MKRNNSDIVGLAVTAGVHLAVILVLWLCVVHPRALQLRSGYLLDFSKQEQMPPPRESAQQRVEKMLSEAGVPAEPRKSLVTDREALKDDRSTDAEQLYRDAERIEREYRDLMNGTDEEVVISPVKDRNKEEPREQQYSGPTVLSYSLAGRKGSYLPIPAYKCIGQGEVTVIIKVDASGKVVDAKVQDEVSSTDRCLRSYALSAARASRFSVSTTGAARQVGNIVYSFIAQ